MMINSPTGKCITILFLLVLSVTVAAQLKEGKGDACPPEIPGPARLVEDTICIRLKQGDELEGIFEPAEVMERDYDEPLLNATNDLKIIVSLGFLFYKTCISSQDRPSCIFTPSCSVYAIESVQKKGLILGWLNAFDRLSRCHGLANHEHYPFDAEKQRFYDPVQ